jgi:hypothetical protein
MNTAKEQVQQLLDQLPDNATLGDIRHKLNDGLHALYVQQQIAQGIKEFRAGLVIPHTEVRERFLSGKY